jgi:hypothetical protein
MSPSFKGTTSECLASFASRPNSVEQLSQMLPGAHIRTIERWLKEKHQEPAGEYLIRVRVTLAMLGYEVAEFAQLSPVLQKACKLCALDITSIDDLVIAFGYEQGSTGRTQLFKVLREGVGMMPERQRRVEEFIADLDGLISEGESAFKARFALRQQAPVAPCESRAVHTAPSGDAKAILDSLAHGVTALLPLADRVLTDDYSASDREYLRAAAGGNGVFRLANALYRLCGERARTQISSRSTDSNGGAR